MATKTDIQLPNGAKMRIFGLGTWQSKPGEVCQAVEVAVKAGYRHIDGAWAYQNETEVGQALKNLFSAGIVKREDIFVTTKLHGYFHKREEVENGIRDSLKNLGLDYIDLYLIHSPIPLEGMEDVCKKGLTKAIGLSNFNQEQIQRIYDNAEIKPANLQVECHAYWPQFHLHEFCKKLGISFTAYGPIGSPARRNAEAEPDLVLMENPVVLKIAEKYKKTPAQVLLRWLMQRDIIVIPKSVTPQRIQDNFKVWDFGLDGDDMAALSGLEKKRLFLLEFAASHPFYPYKAEASHV